MPLGTEIGLVLGDIVLDRDPAPHKEKHGGTAAPYFSTHVHCGQTAGWIRMPLCTMVGLGPGHVVLEGIQLPPKWHSGPNFWPMSVVAKRLGALRYRLARR